MTARIVVVLLAAALGLPAAAAAAPPGWDATPLKVETGLADYPRSGPAVETSDDGAVWVAWGTATAELVVRRVSPDGVVGAARVLTTSHPTDFTPISMAAAPGGAMRIAYASDGKTRLSVRRLTAETTGDPVVLYDRDTTVDGDGAANNGLVFSAPLRLLAAPDGKAWALFTRENNLSAFVYAVPLDAGDAPGPATDGLYGAEVAGAVDPTTGRLVLARASGSRGRMVVQRVGTDGSVTPEVEIRASEPLPPPPDPVTFVSATEPAIGIDAAGVATVGWDIDSFVLGHREAEVRRVDTTPTTMLPLGSGPLTLYDAGVPATWTQYAPQVAVVPSGGAVTGVYETDSSNGDSALRGLAAPTLADPLVVGPRVLLDAPAPINATISALMPGADGLASAFLYSYDNTTGGPPGCRLARLDPATGALVGGTVDTLRATDCSGMTGPSSTDNGLVGVWVPNSEITVMLIRKATTAPVCSDASVSVVAGSSVTLPLACTGWRPERQVTAAPSKGVLGAIDQVAGTVTYTAGDVAGADSVGYRAGNGVGDSAGAVVSVTVTAKPVVTPAGGGGPGGVGGPGGGGGPAADRVAPVISGVALSPASVKRAKRRVPALRFTLSEAADVTVTLERLVPGRRVKGRCVTKPAPKAGAPGVRCTKAVRVSRVVRSAPAGAAKLSVSLKRGEKLLAAGRYRLTIAATDAAGNASGVASVGLRIR